MILGAGKRSCETYTVDEEYVAFELLSGWAGLMLATTMSTSRAVRLRCLMKNCPAWTRVSGLHMETVMAELGVQAVSIPHATPFTGHDWKVRDDDLRPVAEIYSAWGNSLDETMLGNVAIGLRHGQRMGFIGASDNHEGFIGNDLQGKNVLGGLGAIQATELSSRALIEAMQRRSTYATTGDRILVRFQVEDGSAIYGAGDEWVRSGEEQAPPRLIAEVNGTGCGEVGPSDAHRCRIFRGKRYPAELGVLGQLLGLFLEADLNLFPEETNIFGCTLSRRTAKKPGPRPSGFKRRG